MQKESARPEGERQRLAREQSGFGNALSQCFRVIEVYEHEKHLYEPRTDPLLRGWFQTYYPRLPEELKAYFDKHVPQEVREKLSEPVPAKHS